MVGPNKAAVVLLSGGIDSTVAAILKAREPFTLVHLLSIRYGQGGMDSEWLQAQRIASWLLSRFPNVVEHFVLTLDGDVLRRKTSYEDAKGHVLDLPISEPTGFVGWRRPGTASAKAGYPSTRDETFTLLAAAGAEARLRDLPFLQSAAVVLATNKDDLIAYNDILPANYSTHLTAILDKKQSSLEGRKITIELPLIEMSKVEVIECGLNFGAPLDLTWSCYFGVNGVPCSNCDQCRWRADAFLKLRLRDPYTPL